METNLRQPGFHIVKLLLALAAFGGFFYLPHPVLANLSLLVALVLSYWRLRYGT